MPAFSQTFRFPENQALRFLVAFLCIFLVAGCASRKKKIEKPSAPVVIGKVSLINRDLEFLLIDTPYTPPAGTPLRAIAPSGEETALLTVSQEKRRPFIIANIDEGQPNVGDRVIMEPKFNEEPVTTEAPENLIEPAANLPAHQPPPKADAE